MLQPRLSQPLRRVLFTSSTICSRCQTRAFSPLLSQTRAFSSARILRAAAPEPKPESKEDEQDVFIPKPLGRPIGFQHPPQAGENSGLAKVKKDYSGMSLKERNLAKRADIVEKWGHNYFRDFKNIRKYRSGKTFVANPRIFKKEVALYFPNFHGETLAESAADTTPVLTGKVSVVNVYSSHWGETQVQTFTGKKENPELRALLEENPQAAQMVDVNVEENPAKAWIIALFQWRLRRQRSKEDWGKYFVVRKGVSERIRETIGLLNSRVGYVYLVDQDCKIRWAGSANAEGTEAEDLNRGLKRLIEEAKSASA
ncbi:hypothetical protein BS50DRAFT_180381 [Corynespora cassiicola Philippines]|uniref:Mitochondrial ATPase complex subunit ATP10 n=1 Tax=Corynespora cassiicola Philippines TaxID=1448308 RepID=A0A2T2P638_CORCC|nr:hypothetical protein BS50DRAFT_180381 [Corynespora cassiicola Philippines]